MTVKGKWVCAIVAIAIALGFLALRGAPEVVPVPALTPAQGVDMLDRALTSADPDLIAVALDSGRVRASFGPSVRKAVVTQFPFCVYYREETARLRVIAVFHTKRAPKNWQSRV